MITKKIRRPKVMTTLITLKTRNKIWMELNKLKVVENGFLKTI